MFNVVILNWQTQLVLRQVTVSVCIPYLPLLCGKKEGVKEKKEDSCLALERKIRNSGIWKNLVS